MTDPRFGSFATDSAFVTSSGKFVTSDDIKTVENSSITVYDVKNLKRMSQIIMPPYSNPRKTAIVSDVAFKANEKSVALVYYYDWETSRMSEKEYNALKKSEDYTESLSGNPLFAEIDLASGNVIFEKKFNDLFGTDSLFSSLKLNSDGSSLSYFHQLKHTKSYNGGSGFTTYITRNISICDTSDWNKRTITQDARYEPDIRRQGSSYQIDKGKVYFFCYKTKRELSFEERDKMTWNETYGESDYVFSEIDLINGVSRDITSIHSIGIEAKDFHRFSISPDGKKAVLVGTLKEYMGKNSFYLLVVDLNNNKPIIKKMKISKDLDLITPIDVAWLNQTSVVLTIPKFYIRTQARFFYVDLTKELAENESD